MLPKIFQNLTRIFLFHRIYLAHSDCISAGDCGTRTSWYYRRRGIWCTSISKFNFLDYSRKLKGPAQTYLRWSISCSPRILSGCAWIIWYILVKWFAVRTNNQIAENIKKIWAPEVATHLPNAILLLVGCEIDLIPDEKPESAVSHDQVLQIIFLWGLNLISIFQASKLAEEIGAAAYLECSTFRNVGVQEVFEKVAELCAISEPAPKDRPQLSNSSKQKKRIPTTLRVKIFFLWIQLVLWPLYVEIEAKEDILSTETREERSIEDLVTK